MQSLEKAEGAENPQVSFQKCIVVLVGLPLTGKSTLGCELARRSNLVLLDVDEARRQLFLSRDFQLPSEQEAFVMIRSYQKMHELAHDQLMSGQPVVMAATYSRPRYHEMLKELVKGTDIPLKIFLLTASDQTIHQRIQARQEQGNLSNVKSPDAYYEVKNRYQPIEGVSSVIDAEQPVQQNIQQILESLSGLMIKWPLSQS